MKADETASEDGLPPPLTVVSAFTGLGGLDLGFEAAGFEPVGFLETDAVAQRSLKANRGEWRLLGSGDVLDVGMAIDSLGKAKPDALIGAPPCQPFSRAAGWTRSGLRGTSDVRFDPVGAFFQVAGALAPRVIVMENVRGFVSGKTSALSELERLTQELSGVTGEQYELDFEVFDMSSYGIPQARTRAIVLVWRGDGEWSWPRERELRVAWDALSPLPVADSPLPTASGSWADLLASVPEGLNYQWFTDRGGGAELFGYRTRYWSFLRKLHRYEPSPTLSASPGPATGPFHWSGRPLTAKEMLALQTFPQSWVVEGTRRQQVHQIGNATPPLFAELIARSCRSLLGRGELSTEPMYSVEAYPRQHGPLPLRPLAPQYKKMSGRKAGHPGEGLGPGSLQSQEGGQ